MHAEPRSGERSEPARALRLPRKHLADIQRALSNVIRGRRLRVVFVDVSIKENLTIRFETREPTVNNWKIYMFVQIY